MILNIPIFAQQIEDDNRKNHVYFGVHTNQLIRQLVNFGSSSSIPTNPFLINIAVNAKETGNGFNVGFGYSYDRLNDTDQNIDRTTIINNFGLRFGYDKKIEIWEKWQVAWGLDGLVTDNKNETVVKFPIGSNVTSTATTINRTYQFGFGGRFGLNFFVSKKVLLGTEMSYYFKSGRSKFFEGDIDSNPERDSKINSFKPELPGVLYLIVIF